MLVILPVYLSFISFSPIFLSFFPFLPSVPPFKDFLSYSPSSIFLIHSFYSFHYFCFFLPVHVPLSQPFPLFSSLRFSHTFINPLSLHPPVSLPIFLLLSFFLIFFVSHLSTTYLPPFSFFLSPTVSWLTVLRYRVILRRSVLTFPFPHCLTTSSVPFLMVSYFPMPPCFIHLHLLFPDFLFYPSLFLLSSIFYTPPSLPFLILLPLMLLSLSLCSLALSHS